VKLCTFERDGALRAGVVLGDAVVDLSVAAPDLPRDVVALLNAELAAILGDAEVRAGLLKQGLSPRTGTPAELAKLIETDLERWGRVVREARISAD